MFSKTADSVDELHSLVKEANIPTPANLDLVAGDWRNAEAFALGKPRGSGWDSGRTKLPNPRAPPTPSDADRGGGWERVRRDCRAEGSLEATAQSKR